MTKRSLIFVLASGLLALAACKSESSGTGGGGGGSQGGAGTGGNGTACVDTCAVAITDGGEVCAGNPGDALYADLVSCANGACPTECAGLIGGGASDATCGDCLTTSCSTEQSACNNDL